MAALVGQGADALTNLVHEMENSAGVTDRISKQMLAGMYGVVVRLESAFRGLMIEVGESLEPTLISMGETIITIMQTIAGSFLPLFSELSPLIHESVVVLGGFLALLSPMMFAIAGVSSIVVDCSKGYRSFFGSRKCCAY